ncbi:MAG: TolC family protein [Nitrospirae bacterium]|nr:TolC family protein [Nitrospirota bacterium]
MRFFPVKIKLFFIAVLLNFAVQPSYSLTLDEAISLAKETLPSYKASHLRVKSTEALYNASLSPYLPRLDASAYYQRLFTSSNEYNTRIHDLTLSYNLFDWGNRKANRNIARLNLDISKEDLRRSLLDLEFEVKLAYYTAIAMRETIEHRKIQLRDAQKDFEVADGRYKFGVAKLSDVLHASVRLEQAKFNLVQAEGDHLKALSELNSLIGKSLDSTYIIEGRLDLEVPVPDIERISKAALQRPEIKQAEDFLKISENNKSAILSSFFPAFSVGAAYTKTGGDTLRSSFSEEKTAFIAATWNIFELGKFFNLRSSKMEIQVSIENLDELKRQLLLDVYKTYEDFITALNKLSVAKQQLEQAEHNYSEAFAEYKVGKADILSLVQAESLLANAREQLINSRLNIILSKSLLERVAGVKSLELFQVKN